MTPSLILNAVQLLIVKHVVPTQCYNKEILGKQCGVGEGSTENYYHKEIK